MSRELVYLLLIFGLLVVPRALQRWKLPAPLTCLLFGIVAMLAWGDGAHDAVVGLLATLGISSLFLFAGLEVDLTELRRGLEAIASEAATLPGRPKVYFEEWDEPPITGIRWVAELVRIAGGDDVFPELAAEPLARARILADPSEVVRRAPDIIIGSWCGKKFRPERVAARPGWDAIPAVRDGELHEVKSPLILQPGPAALTDGVRALARIVHGWAARR